MTPATVGRIGFVDALGSRRALTRSAPAESGKTRPALFHVFRCVTMAEPMRTNERLNMLSNDQVVEAGRWTRAAIRERDLADPTNAMRDNMVRDANAIIDAALALRQYLFDGEHGAPDLAIVQIAEAIREAAVAEIDEANDASASVCPDCGSALGGNLHANGCVV